MRFDTRLLCLPASILFLTAGNPVSAQSSQESQTLNQWPWNLPKHVKYWPEDPPNRRRDLEAVMEHLRQGRSPVGVMKMSADEGEKFFMEYWQFEGDDSISDQAASLRRRGDEQEVRLLANSSMGIEFRPPFSLHTESGSGGEGTSGWSVLGSRSPAAALALLEKRGFTCPTGTASCSAIGYSNLCCTTGETCFVITDTGLGPVGCCPNGSTCGGSVSSCSSPNTPCADSMGGGCCIPNYVCEGVGCVINSTLVTTVTITQVVTLSSSTSTHTTTVVITVSSSTTTSQTTSACTGTYTACPASLGGGCCPTDRACASSSCVLPSTSITTTTTTPSSSTSTSATGVAPVRPTSDTVTTTQTSSASATSCPTGFYACSAYYQGGCCRTGRNCDSTSCPVTSSTTIISSGLTIVVPVGSAATITSPTGSCATGWSSCAASVGGNCCPTGYDCGTASCSLAGTSATSVIQKESPNAGNVNKASQVMGLGNLVMWVLILGVVMF